VFLLDLLPGAFFKGKHTYHVKSVGIPYFSLFKVSMLSAKELAFSTPEIQFLFLE